MTTTTPTATDPRARFAEAQARMNDASAIAKRAENEARDFTTSEKVEVKAILDEFEAAKANLERTNARVAADAELYAQLQELSVPAPAGSTTGPEYAASEWFAANIKSTSKAALTKLRSGGAGAKALNPSGSIDFPTRLPGVQTPRRFLTLTDLLQHVTIQSGELQFLRQITRTTNAAPVPLGTLKPTSQYAVEQVTETLSTVAHLSEALPRQFFEDDPSLSQFMESEMVQGVAEAVENQVVNGDGIGANLTGFLTVSGTRAQPFTTSAIVTLRKCLTQLEAANIRPTAIVLAPADFEAIELAQGTDGQYVTPGLPNDAGPRRLFGIDVATAASLAPGTAIVGDFTAALLADRGAGNLSWSEYADGSWERNLISWRAEVRVALAVRQPLAFVIADLAA